MLSKEYELKIDLLINCPETIPALAKMWHELLGKIWVPDITVERTELKFHEHLNNEKLPLTVVALDGGQPIGMCSLRENDGIRPDLTPWLGSLVVSQKYQRQGIAERLMDAVKAKAREQGFKQLYLFTFDPTLPNYYRRHGWEDVGKDMFRTYEVTVMKIIL